MSHNRSDAAPETKRGRSRVKANGKSSGAASLGVTLNDAHVADYLRRNPGFFDRHPSLLDVMDPPARQNGEEVADLQQFMIARLREDLAKLRGEHDELLFTGRTNLAAQARVHEAVLALLAAPSFEHLIEVATTDLAVILDLDAAVICVEAEKERTPHLKLRGLRQVRCGLIDELMGGHRCHLLLSEHEGDRRVFGGCAGLVASQALVRLDVSSKTPPALLALGSRQPDHFHPGQGAELLRFLGRCLERILRGWLNLPE